MPKLQQIARIEHPKVRSLVWNGNQLIDWVGGGTVFELDGTIVAAKVRYAFAFNAACSSADNMFFRIPSISLYVRRYGLRDCNLENV